MAETLSLSELKAQNAQIEETETEEIEDEILEDEVEDETEPDGDVDSEDEGEELELWQQKEDESEGGKVIDHSGWKKQRLKTKALKAENREKDEKLQALQLEVERLKGGNQSNDDKPPTLEEFDFDEAKYQSAVANYFATQVDKKLNIHSQAQREEYQLKKIAEQTERSVNEHYERAEKLIGSGKVKEDDFISADKTIRQTLDRISNGNGDVFADQLISQLNNSGDGSEKVWFYLGNNKAAIGRLVECFERDPTGIQAAIYLGNLQQKATTPARKKRSDAPAPAPVISGSASKKMSSAQKAYNKLETAQERISAKRQAKAQGVDTSQW